MEIPKFILDVEHEIEDQAEHAAAVAKGWIKEGQMRVRVALITHLGIPALIGKVFGSEQDARNFIAAFKHAASTASDVVVFAPGEKPPHFEEHVPAVFRSSVAPVAADVSQGLSEAPAVGSTLASVKAREEDEARTMAADDAAKKADADAQAAKDAEEAKEGANEKAIADFIAADAEKGINHTAECAVHNGPADAPGPCDCGAQEAFDQAAAKLDAEERARLANETDAAKKAVVGTGYVTLVDGDGTVMKVIKETDAGLFVVTFKNDKNKNVTKTYALEMLASAPAPEAA